MSYDAKVITVMIASPSDVLDERHVAMEAILDWNSAHSRDRKVVLVPIAWERDSSPKMGDRAQAVINEQLTQHADLLIAVFKNRLGTPTGKAPSGTVEEIKEHLDAGKPAMIYFSSAPVRLKEVDRTQSDAVDEFKGWCKQKGLIEEYDGPSDFARKLPLKLAQTIIREFFQSSSSRLSVGSDTQKPTKAGELSDRALELLEEASRDPTGQILLTRTMGGTFIRTNRRHFGDARDPRSAAIYSSALSDLRSAGLVEDRSGSGQVFNLTGHGYEMADTLAGQGTNPKKVEDA